MNAAGFSLLSGEQTAEYTGISAKAVSFRAFVFDSKASLLNPYKHFMEPLDEMAVFPVR